MPFDFVDVGTRFGKIQVETPGRVLEVIEDFNDLLPGTWHDLSVQRYGEIEKCKYKNDRQRHS